MTTVHVGRELPHLHRCRGAFESSVRDDLVVYALNYVKIDDDTKQPQQCLLCTHAFSEETLLCSSVRLHYYCQHDLKLSEQVREIPV